MDPATRLKLMGALTTAVLPSVAIALPLFIGRRLDRDATARPRLVGLAAVLGVLTAWLGINGWPGVPPAEATAWVPLVAVAAGLLALPLEGRAAPLFTGLGAAALGLGAWRVLAPLAQWDDGIIGPLAREAWVLEPIALGLVAWTVLDRGARDTPAPIALGPLALALGGGAVALALSGSARFGQTLGAFAIAFGGLTLAAWRWPDLRLGRGAIAAGLTALVLMMIAGHAYVELPRPVAALVLLTPLMAGPLLGRKGHLAIFAAAGLAVLPAASAAWLAQAAQSAPAAAPTGGGDAPADDDGTYYPY